MVCGQPKAAATSNGEGCGASKEEGPSGLTELLATLEGKPIFPLARPWGACGVADLSAVRLST